MIPGTIRAADAVVEAGISLGRRCTAAALRLLPLPRALAAAVDLRAPWLADAYSRDALARPAAGGGLPADGLRLDPPG